MIQISDIDPNFKVPEGIPDNMHFFDAQQAPFEIYGVAKNKPGVLCRLPEDMLPECRERIRVLAYIWREPVCAFRRTPGSWV